MLKVGDVVTLKSGGPDMTIETIFEDSSEARCVWFDKMKTERGIFPLDTLEKNEIQTIDFT